MADIMDTPQSIVEQPVGYSESADVAERGANTARVARMQLEEETSKPAVSRLTAKELGLKELPGGSDGNEVREYRGVLQYQPTLGTYWSKLFQKQSRALNEDDNFIINR